MKRTHLLALAAAGAMLLAPAIAGAQGIRNSRHDLSSSSTTVGPQSTDGDEICIFCHTPHNAVATIVLWNRTTATYTTGWTGSTTDGTDLPANLGVGSSRCLTCHDNGATIGDTAIRNPSNSGATHLTAPNSITDPNLIIRDGAGSMDGTHPVSINYAGEGSSGAVGDGTIGNYFGTASGASCDGGIQTCTTAPTTDGRDGSAIKLNGAAGSSTVECASCHEPHNRFGYAGFLRVDNSVASGLCRSCHNK